MTPPHRDEPSRHVTPEDWLEQDSIGSYYAAIEEIGRRVKAGEEPIPTSGYFGRKGR